MPGEKKQHNGGERASGQKDQGFLQATAVSWGPALLGERKLEEHTSREEGKRVR